MVSWEIRELGRQQARLRIALAVRTPSEDRQPPVPRGLSEAVPMPWFTFEVTPIVHGPIVAENLRLLARDPLARAALPSDADVLRRRLENGERFFFSPSAVGVFEPFIKTYGGVPCAPPFEGDTGPGALLRLRFVHGAWEPAGSARGIT